MYQAAIPPIAAHPIQAHIFEVNGRKLAIDPLRCQVVILSPPLADLLSGLEQGENSPLLVAQLTDKWGQEQFRKSCEDFRKLTAKGAFVDAGKDFDYPCRWRADLTITHRCNLACRYCFAPIRDGSAPQYSDLPLDIARRAITFLLENFGEPGSPLTLRFGNTGETLLGLGLQQKVRSLGFELAENSSRKIKFHWGNTNLTPAQEPEIFDQLFNSPYLPHLGISLDGPQDIHDSIRIFPDGRGTHAIVEPLARRLLQAPHPPHGHCTFSGLNPDITRIFTYLYEVGFRDIRLRPVRAAPDSPQGYTPETVAGLKKGFSDWVGFLTRQPDDLLLQYLTAASPKADFLLRFVFRLAAGLPMIYRCPAGKDYICIDTNGDIYPCAYFIASGKMKLGSIYQGIDPAASALFWEELRVGRKASCMGCWARHLCGGGCYYQAFLSHGDIGRPEENKCRLVRHICEQAAYLLSCIHLRPKVKARLFQHWSEKAAPAAAVREA